MYNINNKSGISNLSLPTMNIMPGHMDSLLSQYDRDGAVCLKGVIGDRWVEAIRQGIATNMARPGPFSQNLAGPKGRGAYFNDYSNWRDIPQFYEFVTKSGIAELAGKFMHSSVRKCIIYFIMPN